MRQIVRLLAACSIAAPLACPMVDAQAVTATPQAANADVAKAGAAAVDPYLWLEDVDSPRAMAWVNAENAKTLKILESDPRYPDLHAAALKVAETKDRIPLPRFLANDIYNFWQDADHVRGLWRKTSLADYRTPTPQWSKVLDLDALAKSESANWLWEGGDCLRPSEARCLIGLSDGGEDAVDGSRIRFAEARIRAAAVSICRKASKRSHGSTHEELLIARDLGPGTLTASGYPFVVKALRRGEPLSAAREVFRGTPEDVEVDVDDAGRWRRPPAVLITRGVSFFESKYYWVRPGGPARARHTAEGRDQGARRQSAAGHPQRRLGRERYAFRPGRLLVRRPRQGGRRPAASASDAGVCAAPARVARRRGRDARAI